MGVYESMLVITKRTVYVRVCACMRACVCGACICAYQCALCVHNYIQ